MIWDVVVQHCSLDCPVSFRHPPYQNWSQAPLAPSFPANGTLASSQIAIISLIFFIRAAQVNLSSYCPDLEPGFGRQGCRCAPLNFERSAMADRDNLLKPDILMLEIMANLEAAMELVRCGERVIAKTKAPSILNRDLWSPATPRLLTGSQSFSVAYGP